MMTHSIDIEMKRKDIYNDFKLKKTFGLYCLYMSCVVRAKVRLL